MDKETEDFVLAVEASLRQARRGEYAASHTPAQIVARRGRPAGSVKTVPKIATGIRLDAEVVSAFKASGKGWQTRINDALKDWLSTHSLV